MSWPRIIGLVAMLLVAGPSTARAVEGVLVLQGQLHTGDGQVHEDGVVVIENGRVVSVGVGVEIPDGAEKVRGAVVTPGLVDAMCVLNFEMNQTAGNFRPRGRPGRACEHCVDLHAGHGPVSLEVRGLEDCTVCPHLHGHECGGELPRGGSMRAVLAALRERQHTHSRVNELGELLDVSCGCVCGRAPLEATEAADALAVGVPPSATWAEHSNEVVPHTRVVDSINWFARDFERLVRSGVTTVFVSPDSASVIGARGAIVKTGGDLAQRVVRDMDAVKAAMGRDPATRGVANRLPPGRGGGVTLRTRRPTTRMGVEWVFRKAMYDARRVAAGLPLQGADQPPLEAVDTLNALLAGEIPLRIQARMQHDINTALRLSREFGLQFILEEGTEAYDCLPQLKAAGVPVIFGPIYDTPVGLRRFGGEASNARLSTATALHEAGVPFALTAQEMRDSEGLAGQAMQAVRFGLPRDAALSAITAMPAKLLGLEGEVGVLASGSAGDAVVWSGDPLDATTRPLAVVINGKVVYRDR